MEPRNYVSLSGPGRLDAGRSHLGRVLVIFPWNGTLAKELSTVEALWHQDRKGAFLGYLFFL